MIEVAKKLALKIVEDTEGAKKQIKVKVVGAKSKSDVKKIARSVATSPLVKCAFFGEDANWGRIIMAAGNSKATIDPTKLSLKIGNITILQKGLLITKDFDKKLGSMLKKPKQAIT